MDRARAARLAEKWADGGVCTLRDGEMQEYHEMALEALREQGQRWISVEDRLPEPFVSVLGYCPDEEPLPTVHECYVNGFGQWTSSLVYGMGNVTHWMPIPDPPEEGAP